MLFHTLPFLCFLLIVLPVYYLLPFGRGRTAWLLAASYVFYAWWNPYYLLLVFYSTALDFALVALMDRCPVAAGGRADCRDPVLRFAFAACLAGVLVLAVASAAGPVSLRPACIALAAVVGLMAAGAGAGRRRLWLAISVINNLFLLLFFKYARFVIDNLNGAATALHLPVHLSDPSAFMPHPIAYALPAGISFFTFQSMSYTIDFYLGKTPRERSFLRFATFVCFFPQLMAGPIERARQMLPQLARDHRIIITDITDGLSLFLVGLFKKLALADYLALYVDRVYDNPERFHGSALAMATLAFAWQIYFDFSGYTDMARGVAKMLGFNLVLNFNNPYTATGLADFWSRWHISLSTWFRDYVYIPLGGSRHGRLRTCVNLMITFLVSGLWHGANWTFCIWGALHGAGLIVTRGLERSPFYRERVPRPLKQIWTFAFVCFCWIFFRAQTVGDARIVCSRLLSSVWLGPQVPALMLLLVGLVWLYEMVYESHLRPLLSRGYVRVALATCMVLYLCLCASSGGTFIYFQF